MGNNILSKRPALRVALLFVAGILLAQASLVDPQVFLLLGFVTVLATLVLFFKKYSTASSLTLHAVVVFTAASLTGVESERSESERLLPRTFQEPVRLEGVINAQPVQKPSSVQLLVRTRGMVRSSGAEGSGRTVIVFVRTKQPARFAGLLRIGSRLRVQGVIDDPPRPRNPGEFDYGRYLALNEVDGVVRVAKESDVEVLGVDESFSLSRMFQSTRNALLERIELFHSSSRGAFLKGILLAERGEIPLELKQSFVDTGTIHILAVSGLHVGVIAAIVHFIFGLLRFPRKGVVLATMLALLLYAGLTGAPPSVVRATIMAWVVLAGTFFERRGDVYNSIGFAALLILAYDPKQLLNVGFQLSFAAVLSIVALYPILERIIQRIPERFEELKIIDPALKLFAVSLAAQLGTLPFTAYYFERVSIVALVANLVVVPISLANVSLGFVTLLTSLISQVLASWFAIVNDVLIDFLYGIVTAAANVPYAFLETAGLGTAFPLLYYLGLGSLFMLHLPRVAVGWWITLLVTANAFLYGSLFSGSKIVLTASLLDVGQGDAILISLPNGKKVLVDAGPQGFGYDAGERIVAPFLKRQGVSSLDVVLVSHPHSDHLGGIRYLLEHFQVGTLVEADSSNASRMHGELRSSAVGRKVTMSFAGAGATLDLDSTCRIYVLHPVMLYDREGNLNNHSLVLKIVYGRTSMLLTGDAEVEAEGKILARYGPFLDSDVLKAGHHGSVTSSSEEFINGVSPASVLVSVGKNNKFKHPSPLVMERYRSKGVEVLRTDLEGAIVLESNGERFERAHWRN
ncbi:MAG: DNA internalization-related competence protein ComEC/Rec2 [Ignavibacteriales bacterium]|nr:DNA internalization-related competence protein ComEC/Rec2 [Ignavibacteriales bacterium]